MLRDVLMRERPDVVHFHNVFPLLTPAAIAEAHRYGASVVLTVHNYRFACPAGTLLRNGQIHEDCIEGSSLLCGLRNSRGLWSESIAYGVALEIQRRLRFLHRWVDAYVAPSHFVATMLGRAGYPKNRIHTISHGTRVADTPSAVGDYALYAGRLISGEGNPNTRRSVAACTRRPIGHRGCGAARQFRRCCSEGSISYRGHVNQTAAAELMRGALFTLMPSEWYEGQPYGALESMAVGTPLVASRLGALAEVTEDRVTGVLVPPGDPAALAAAMQEIWENKKPSRGDGTESMGIRERALLSRGADQATCPTLRTTRLFARIGIVPSQARGRHGDHQRCCILPPVPNAISAYRAPWWGSRA